MSAPMILRRWLAAGVILALLAPALLQASGGSTGSDRRAMAAGAACCGAMACCVKEAPCATGSCDRGEHTTAPPQGPRLAAGCPGAVPATAPSGFDPMLPATGAALTVAAEPRQAFGDVAVVAPIRGDTPSVPPPRV